MKKRFFQLHIVYIFLMMLIISFALLGVYVTYVGICYNIWIVIVSGLFIVLISIAQIVATAYYHVTFTENKILISGDLLSLKERNQFKDLIEYKDISDIKIVIDNKNSKNKPFPWHDTSRNTPRTYFEFALNNGKRKRMFIFYFSKRQRIKMLDIINEKCNLNKDYMTMYNEHK